MAPSPQMTSGQARVVDPILSTHARGYRHPERVGRALFPAAQVPARGAKVLRFGKEGFRLVNTRRAPGAATGRVQYGYASDPISVYQESLEGLVPEELMEDAAQVPGVDLASGAVEMVMDIVSLGEEKAQADLATDPNNYGADNKVALGAGARWSDSGVDPKVTIDEGKESIRQKIGMRPNTLLIGAQVTNSLTSNRQIKDQFKHTSADSITLEMLARYFQLETVVEGTAIYADEGTDAFVDIWGNVAVLAYVARGSNFRMPSYGYTYELPGMPMVEEPYSDRNRKSWIYPVTSEYRPYLVGQDAGYLIQTPVAPAA